MTGPVEERAYRWPRRALLLLTVAAIITLVVTAWLVLL
jgi:hypothetical protein